MPLVTCPICSKSVKEDKINDHIDTEHSLDSSVDSSSPSQAGPSKSSKSLGKNIAPIFASKAASKPQGAVEPLNNKNASSSKRVVSTDIEEIERPAKKSRTIHFENAMPLAERLRPTDMKDFVGHSQVTSLLGSLHNYPSIIFWGPPGCGKTTLARLLSNHSESNFKELSATGSGVNDVRVVFEEAKRNLALTGRRTTLFMDEIHRFNKAQQDIFLPYVEQGHIQLIGATTENPSFKLIPALVSRCRILVLDGLTEEDILTIVRNAITRLSETVDTFPITVASSQPDLSSSPTVNTSQSNSDTLNASDDQSSAFPHFTPNVMSSISRLAAGDARTAISLTEVVINSPKDSEESVLIGKLRRLVSSTYNTENHYDQISALHKSIRGSHGSSLYWLSRMLQGGEDPLFICRRLIVCASEDIGLADNNALLLAIATMHACERIGMPECRINLAHLVAYLTTAPKSTRSYEAYKAAEEAAKADPALPVPLQVRNAPTSLMRELGYGESYMYNPSFAHPVHNTYLPLQLEGETFLKDEEAYQKDRIWDEDALRKWELAENGGNAWSGRKCRPE